MTAIAEPVKGQRRAAPRPLPGAIAGRLAALRGRLAFLDIALGGSWVLFTIGAYIHGTFILDRLLELPVPFRATLLALGVGGVAFTAWRLLARPILVERTDDALALLYEEKHPELNDALISAVQLSRGAAPDLHEEHSDAMVGEVVAAAEARSAALDPRRVADGSDAGRAALLAAALVAITVFLFATRERDGSIWFQRMLLLRDIPWPRTVELEVVVDEPVVARGDDVTVRARVLRGAPSRIVVHPEVPSVGRVDPVPMVDARGEWRAVLENVAEPFRLFVEGGDYKSAWIRVDVRPRPRLDELRVWLVHPPYTRIADTPEGEPLKDLNVKVPGGTLVRWRARASAPLKAGELLLAPAAAAADVRADAPGAGGDARDFSGELRVKESLAATFRLVSADGFETPVAGQYQVRAVTDRLPDVRIAKPGRNKDVARGASVALRVEVRDDYEPRAAALVYQVLPAKRPKEPGPEVRVPLPGLPPQEAGQKSVTIDFAFDLTTVSGGLENGDRVTYWVEAVDERAREPETTAVPPESRGRSEKYQLHAIAEDELLRQQQQSLKRIRDDLAALAKAEKATAGDLEALAQELPARAAPDARDRRRITYAELDHRKALQRIESARQSLGDVREEMVANKVNKDEDLRWVADLEAGAERLVKDQGARAAEGLARLRQEDRPDPARVLDVAAAQREVVEGLEEMVRRLTKWDEFNEVLRDVRDLLNIQERIYKDTQDRAKQDLGR